jgi:NAD(P)-dependent dehydrogenase (short-subunit alcohol dehydrogenase family)
MECREVRADVASAADWKMLTGKIISEDGHLDILVNNAGGGGVINDCDKQTAEDITKTIAINLTGSILGCGLAAGIMKKQKSGTIINISSVCARQAWPGWSVYSAAKAGLVQFSKSLYLEMRPFGVSVTSLIPSWGATGFNAGANLPEFDRKTAEKCIQPEEIGRQVVNICELPAHLCIQDVTILPLVQEINPL